MAERYPLNWPEGRPRTAGISRKPGQFGKRVARPGNSYKVKADLTIADAIARLNHELPLLGAKDVILSSNLKLNRDSSVTSAQANPADPGVALYFNLGGKPHCMPCDRYVKAADNIAALAAHIEATRAIERYGVTDMATMFTGFLALPPAGGKRPWRVVMGYGESETPTAGGLKARYRTLALDRHPDTKRDDGSAMAELNAARDEAEKALGFDAKAIA